MQIPLRRDPEAVFDIDYDEDPEPDPAKRAWLGISPLLPREDDDLREQFMDIKTPNLNGRFRRQVTPRVKFRQTDYEIEVFVRKVKRWGNLFFDEAKTEPIPYSEEHARLIAEHHRGLRQFACDMAAMLGEMTLEEIQKERDTFRLHADVSAGRAGD